VWLTRREAENAEEYLIDQFGRSLYNAFFGPYTEKVWAVDPRQLDADFTRDRVPTLNLWSVIRNMLWSSDTEQKRFTPSGRIPAHELNKFYYPRNGAGALPEAYARKVSELGGRFSYQVELDHIDLAERRIVGRSNGEAFQVAFDTLVSTIPLNGLVPLLRPHPPAEIRELAAGLRYRGILLVNLCVDKPTVIDPFWIYFTDRFFNRISEYKHFDPDLVPEGKTGICLEVGCDPGDELWGAEDAEIVKRCLPDLVELGLLSEDQIEDYMIIRERHAYPIYTVGYKQRINRLIGWLEGDAKIMTAGRQGRFLYINQDAAIKSGLEAGEAAVRLMETGTVEPTDVWSDDRPRRQIVSS
jgi:protoporphyrinogen oxidase